MAQTQDKSILAPTSYDDDAVSLRSASDQALDSDSAHTRDKSKDPLEVDDFDRSLLREEEEHEHLLAGHGSKNCRNDAGDIIGGRKSRKHRRKRRSKSEWKLMEEGFKDSSSRTSSSDSLATDKARQIHPDGQNRRFSWQCLLLVPLAISAVFLGLAIGAFRASSSFRHTQSVTQLSNGTHRFAPTTILISLDGFRADFLNRGLTPALSSFIASGVSPRYMLPSFPSVTFPNHFTLVTGLYPESHGVVGNSFWDPDLGEEFYYTDPLRSLQPKWWNAEPLWVTAESQGIRTSIHSWPGSEAHIPSLDPTYLDKFNGSEVLPAKVARILELLDMPGDLDPSEDLSPNRRPQLIAAYVPNVDADGHRYGPNGTEIRATIADVDSMLAVLMEGLYDRNLSEIVNVVVVSDHGMATTSNIRLVQLDDLIDLSLVDHIDGWPLRGLRLKDPSRDMPILYEQLLKESEKSAGFDVYTLETMPERYHFTNNNRIAPLWVVPKTGWAIVERSDFDVAKAQAAGTVYHPLGLHGYDHEHPLMRAIFVARGPAFPHAPNSRVAVFQNIEVYNIICDSLGIEPHPNNGTIRLPFKTEGFHHDEGAPELETPHDPPNEQTDPNQDSPISPAEDDSDNPTTDEAPEENQPAEGVGDHEEDAGKGWWDFMHDQFEKVKEWANGVIAKLNSDGRYG